MRFAKQREIEMHYAEMTEIGGGPRELSDIELAVVAGGGIWQDLGKIAGALGGNVLIGGAVGSAVGAGVVVLGIAVYNGYDSSIPAGTGVNTNIGDAAL